MKPHEINRIALKGIAKQVALVITCLTGRHITAGYLRAWCRPCSSDEHPEATGEPSPLERFIYFLIGLHKVDPKRARTVFAYVESIFTRLETEHLHAQQCTDREVVAHMMDEVTDSGCAQLCRRPLSERQVETFEAMAAVRRLMIFQTMDFDFAVAQRDKAAAEGAGSVSRVARFA